LVDKTVFVYALNLEHMVPADHLLRRIDAAFDPPPFYVPVAMFVLARFPGRADPAVAHQSRRPDQSVWARWLVVPGVDSPTHCAA